MASCKDCLSADSCKIAIEFEFDKAERMFDFDCKHFKDRNRFVELPKYSDKNEIVGSTPEQPEITEEQLRQEWVNYKKKDLAGLLLDLPCKVGDTVYVLLYEYLKVIEKREIGCIHITGSNDFSIAFYEDTHGGCFGTVADIGETVFLTKSEAEQALKEM